MFRKLCIVGEQESADAKLEACTCYRMYSACHKQICVWNIARSDHYESLKIHVQYASKKRLQNCSIQYRFVTIMSARYGTGTLRRNISFCSVRFHFVLYCLAISSVVSYCKSQEQRMIIANVWRQEPRAENNHSEWAKAKLASFTGYASYAATPTTAPR